MTAGLEDSTEILTLLGRGALKGVCRATSSTLTYCSNVESDFMQQDDKEQYRGDRRQST